MNRLSLAVAFVAVFGSQPSYAEKIPNADDPPLSGTPACPLGDYKSEGQKFDPSIKLIDEGKLDLGPIKFESDCPGEEIADVIVDVEIDHDWLGDLVMDLYYDEDCNGEPDAGPVRLLCRQGSSGCGAEGDGCSGDLIFGPYTWSDAAAEELGVPTCSGVLTPGCYKPSSSGPPLSIFEGLKKDGCWTLEISDLASGDDGLVYGWSVHLLNKCETNATESSSWGALKRLYND